MKNQKNTLSSTLIKNYLDTTIYCSEFHGIPQVVVYLDVILVTGLSEEDHLMTLQNALQRIESSGLRLKKKKCKFDGSSYFIFRIQNWCSEITSPTEEMDAIVKVPSLTSLTELKSILDTTESLYTTCQQLYTPFVT